MTSTRKISLVLATGCLAALAGCAASPKYLVDHSFRGDTRTSKIMLQENGETVGSGTSKKKLYNTFVRLCDLTKAHQEANCKDTLILPNVVSGTVY